MALRPPNQAFPLKVLPGLKAQTEAFMDGYNLLLEFKLSGALVWGPEGKLLSTLLTSYPPSLRGQVLGIQLLLCLLWRRRTCTPDRNPPYPLGCELLALPSPCLRPCWGSVRPLGRSQHRTLLHWSSQSLPLGSLTPMPVCLCSAWPSYFHLPVRGSQRTFS